MLLLGVGLVYLMTSGQYLFYAAAVMLPMFAYPGFGEPITGTLYYQDIFAAIALGALIFAKFLGRGTIPPVPRTPVVGIPLLIFGIAIASATLRGHYQYGAALFAQPLRLVFYAAIVAGLIGMTVPRMFTFLQVIFYSGAVYVAVLATAFIATGGSSTSQDILSTGGTRPISITTSVDRAGSLFLAMLNLCFESGSRWRLLHLTIAALSLFGVVCGFGRAVYASVGVVGLVFLLTSPRLRRAIYTFVPLALPSWRCSSSASATPRRTRRLHAGPRAVRAELGAPTSSGVSKRTVPASNRRARSRSSGRDPPNFVLHPRSRGSGDRLADVPSRRELGEDPHNGYMYLLAGGGVFALGAFLLIIGVFVVDGIRRYRACDDPRGRLIILWAAAFLFVFLFNAASATMLASPENILTIWALLVLPAVGAADARGGVAIAG